MTDDPFGEAKRKLAAILAMDVVGFSRMMGAEEEETLASLGRARDQVIDPIVARHRGRVSKVMGDGLLTDVPSSSKPLTPGRQAPNVLVLADTEVSRLRCRVELVDRAPVVTDPRSTNGTFANDRRVGEPVRLAPGATLRIGSVRLRYVLDLPAAASDETQVVRR